MSDRKKFKQKIKDKLIKFEKAAVNKSWKGSQDPRDFEAIEEDYRITKKHLIDFIMTKYDGLALEKQLNEA